MIRLLIFLIAVCFASFATHAADKDNAKVQLKQVEDQLTRQKEEAATLDAKTREATENLRTLKQKLIDASANLATKQEEQDRLENELTDLAKDIATKTTELASERRKLGLLTQALIDLSQQPPASLLLQAGLTTNTIHRTIMLRAIVPRVKQQTETLAQDLVVLDDLKIRRTEQKRLLAATTANLQDQQRALDQLIATRQGLIQRTEQQKQAIAAQLVSLAGQAKDLRQLLEKVTPSRRRAPRAPSAGPEAKLSTLKTPVAGRILHHFGDKDADGVISEGVTFSALPAAPVVAPMAGHVAFAGNFRGYGRIVILQHTGGYHSFLAGFGRIDTDMGEDVEAGEPLGVMPIEKNARPQLYFEWRHNSEPVQPAGLQ